MIQDIHHVEQSKSNSVMQHLSINNTRNHNKTSKINIKFRHDCSLQMAQTAPPYSALMLLVGHQEGHPASKN